MIALLERIRDAKANLPAKEEAPPKGAWFPAKDEKSGWAAGAKGKTTQGSLQAGSLGWKRANALLRRANIPQSLAEANLGQMNCW